MILYQLKKSKLQFIEHASFKAEKEIQSIVEENVEDIFNLKFVFSEYIVGEFRFDTVCFDEEANSFVIIEYKKDNSFSIIDQGYSYLSTMLSRKSDFILDYNEFTGENLKKNDVDWSQSKIIFVSTHFSKHQKNSINFKDMPFELWEIKKFSNDIISFNQHFSSSTESIKKVPLSKNNSITNVNKEVKTYSVEELLLSCGENVRSLWSKILEKITGPDFPGTLIKITKTRVRFCSEHNQVICYFYFKTKHITIKIMSGTIYGDGSKGKYFAEFDDYKGITKEKIQVWKGYGKKYKAKFGTDKDPVNLTYDLNISNSKEINYFLDLIQNRYHITTKMNN